MKKLMLIVLCVAFMVCGCKIRTISDGKPPKDGVIKSTRKMMNGETMEMEEHFKNSQLVREVMRFDNKNLAYERFFRTDEHPTDSMRNYYRNGQLSLLLVMNDTNRVILRGYYENGTLQAYGDTAKNIEYFDNGKKQSETLSKTGQIYKILRWYRNGLKAEESDWWNDRRNGIWREWDSTGTTVRNERYRDGQLVTAIHK
ncbi:MAG: hypothetical protein WCW40_04220 [Bacteroidota bacterium]